MSFTFAPLTRRTSLGLATLSLAALALSAAHPAAAQTPTTITYVGATAPTPGAADVYDLNSSGTIQGPNDDYAANVPSPGQTFTTGSNAGGYLLNSLTQKGGGIAGNGYETGNFVVDISSVSGTTLTLLNTFTASALPLINDSTGFFTIDLSGATLTLAANTQYAYDIYSTNGYYGLASSVNPPATGEFAFVGNSTHGVSTSFKAPTEHATIPYNRTFDVGLTASPAPEPSGGAVMGFAVFGVLGLLWRAKKRSASELAS